VRRFQHRNQRRSEQIALPQALGGLFDLGLVLV
jgi:hypothetical protein